LAHVGSRGRSPHQLCMSHYRKIASCLAAENTAVILTFETVLPPSAARQNRDAPHLAMGRGDGRNGVAWKNGAGRDMVRI
jgi:hypothetical protein